jgi:hypothetical protein
MTPAITATRKQNIGLNIVFIAVIFKDYHYLHLLSISRVLARNIAPLPLYTFTFELFASVATGSLLAHLL